MQVPAAKENILKKIREALVQTTPVPFAESNDPGFVFQPASAELEVIFAEEFNKLQGKFIFCLNRQELTEKLEQVIREFQFNKIYCLEQQLIPPAMVFPENAGYTTNLKDCDVAITGCEYLVARTGSIVMSSAQLSGRSSSVYAPVHICIAHTSQLVYDNKDAIAGIKNKYLNNLPSLITWATGPSRTADIEKTLIVGVHGPKEVFVFLVD